MLLAIDIGNTNIVYGIFKDNQIIIETRTDSTRKQISLFFKKIKEDITDVIISSVVPDLTYSCQKLCNDKLNIDGFVVKYNNVPNLSLKIDYPEQVGSDRICNTIAALNLYKTPCIVVDTGTATKYDVINEYGEFIGGSIAPGIETSAYYLFKKAALLKKTVLSFPEKSIGKNTNTNIQSGIMYSALDSIDGMIKRMEKETHWDNTNIILTGGFSSIISPHLHHKHILNKQLTLQGLKIIYESYKEEL